MRSWGSEQQQLRTALAGWSAELNADQVGTAAAGEFPHAKWKLIQQTDLLRVPFDERWGGLGQDLLTTMYLLEGLGYESRDGGLNFSVSTHVASSGIPIQQFGGEQLKERFLPAICDGDRIGAHAITEPDSGSDALAMRTTARKDGDHYILNGSKTFVSNGAVADIFVVYARTHPDGGPLGITPFVVERDTPGFTIGNPIAKMELRTAPLTELFFDECRVPASNVIGRPGGGFLVLDYVMKWEVLCSFVINLGEMQHRLEQVIAYTDERSAFGSCHTVSHRIVDMKIGVETTRTSLYDTATKFAAGENITTDLAITKLVASEQNEVWARLLASLCGSSRRNVDGELTLAAEDVTSTDASTSLDSPTVPVAAVHGAQVVTIHLKLEAFNRFGSIKARTATGLVDALEEQGRLWPGIRIVESTSGNLGVALAGIAAERGYLFTAVVDPCTAPALLAGMVEQGAEIDMVAEKDCAGGYLISRLRRVRELTDGRTDRIWSNQYGSPANPRAHELGTAPEIARQAGGAMDAVFVAVSTGGTLAGVGRYLREHHPECRVVGVDVPGSVAFGGPPGPRQLTGIGSSVQSQFLRPWMYDEHIEVEPGAALAACRRLAAQTGIEVGGSGGAVLAACLRYLQAHPEIRHPVCLCPDSGANYRQTIFDDGWLHANGLGSALDPWPGGAPLFLRGEM